MRSDSIVFAIAGMCFGIILGWVIGTQQAAKRTAAVVQMQPAAAAPQPAADAPGTPRQPPPLDEARVQGLLTIIKSDPKNAGAHVQLGNAYFDAERYPDAIKWYEEGLKLDPKNVDASTDLAVSYYYSNKTEDALKQFDYSLKLNPTHTKTLLNQGIVLAFGKRDLKGATSAWEKVVQIAPDSPEAQAAKQGLAGIAAASGRGAPPLPAAGG
jgi:cytochrome c-type biogenesis protein CcmH/NrfG